MECAVCYEAFIIPNNEEECLSIIKEIREKRENYKMLNYLITPKYNTTYKCPTLECKCIIVMIVGKRYKYQIEVKM